MALKNRAKRLGFSLAVVCIIAAAVGAGVALRGASTSAHDLANTTSLTHNLVLTQALVSSGAVYTGTAERTDTTTSTTFADLVPTPGEQFVTTTPSTIMVQFFGSAQVTGGNDMQVRAVIDGVPVNPGAMTFNSSKLTTISYSGFMPSVPAGTHLVTLQWLVTGGTGTIGNRTFTVWVIPN